jgi:hypothetical protein
MLCIDQECVEERTHQVNLMQHIYSMAQEVFLWLGDYPEIALPKADYSLRPIAEDQEVRYVLVPILLPQNWIPA